jgi:polysaccharide export outer membrane protein
MAATLQPFSSAQLLGGDRPHNPGHAAKEQQMISSWNNHSIHFLAALFLSGLASTAAQQQTAVASPDQGSSPSFQERHPRYALRSGDTFDVGFEFSPEFNQSVTVQPDGFVSLREIGDVYVSGLTLPQVQQVVEAKYGSILKQPNISITPKDLEKRYFIAAGEVSHPGKYELRAETTVTEALAMAGGLAPDRAKHSEVVLFRRDGEGLAAGKVVNVKKMLKSRDLREDVNLKPGDLLYVPQNTWSKTSRFVPIPGVGMTLIPGTTF